MFSFIQDYQFFYKHTFYRYLEESLIGLDSEAEITLKHLPGILAILNDQLTKTLEFLSKESPQGTNIKKQIRSLRKLHMASKGMFQWNHISRTSMHIVCLTASSFRLCHTYTSSSKAQLIIKHLWKLSIGDNYLIRNTAKQNLTTQQSVNYDWWFEGWIKNETICVFMVVFCNATVERAFFGGCN